MLSRDMAEAKDKQEEKTEHGCHCPWSQIVKSQNFLK